MASDEEPHRQRDKRPKQHLRTLHEKDQTKRLIIILEDASLETVKVTE